MVPNYMFATYREVTPAFLREKGIRNLLVDIDNTLAPYEQPEPDDNLREWLASLQEDGVKIALVSNNNRERVERFNATLGLDAYPKSGKPGKKTLQLAMKNMGAERGNTALLGDQVLTDAYAGQRLNLPAIIVPPIRDKRTLFFRFKRLLERPFIRKYARRHAWHPFMRFWHVKNHQKPTQS